MKLKSILSILFLSCLVILTSCKNESKEATVNEDMPKAIQKKKAQPKMAQPATHAATSHENIGDLHFASMGEIEELVKKDKKKVLVDVYTDWCGPCKMMDRRTFTDPAVQKAINEKFHMVKFNAEGPSDIEFLGKKWSNPHYKPNKRGRNEVHELSSYFAVRGYPSLVVLDENFKVSNKIVGFKTPEQLLAELKNI